MKKKNIIVSVVLLLMPLVMGAQALKGSYFMDNSVNRHKMNPAFAPRANYFQLPAIGNLGVGLYSNLDMGSFFAPGNNGMTKTFLSGDVSSAQFDKMLAKHPHIDAEVETNLLSFGFYTKRKSFWTFDLGLDVNIDTDIPRDLFTFLKKGTGMGGTHSFNVGNLNLYGMAGVHAALGYSRDMSFLLPGLRIGAKVRGIAPLAYGAVNLENVRLTTSEEKWSIKTEAYANVAAQGLELSLPENSESLMPDFSFDGNKMFANKVLAGFGFSFDFGFEYKLSIGSMFDGISISAAVTDLGRMTYKANAVSSFKSSGEFEFSGFENIGLDTDFSSLPDDIMTELQSLLNLTQKPSGQISTSTCPSFYAGIDVPFLWRTMSVGLLYSGRKSHSYYRQELTASYNLKPCKWFALGVNYSFLNTAKTLGCILEFTPRIGPALYLGTDYVFYEFAKTPMLADMTGMSLLGHLPMSWRLNFDFGIAFNLGSKHLKNKTK